MPLFMGCMQPFPSLPHCYFGHSEPRLNGSQRLPQHLSPSSQKRRMVFCWLSAEIPWPVTTSVQSRRGSRHGADVLFRAQWSGTVGAARPRSLPKRQPRGHGHQEWNRLEPPSLLPDCLRIHSTTPPSLSSGESKKTAAWALPPALQTPDVHYLHQTKDMIGTNFFTSSMTTRDWLQPHEAVARKTLIAASWISPLCRGSTQHKCHWRPLVQYTIH